jgi:hypothetical protein
MKFLFYLLAKLHNIEVFYLLRSIFITKTISTIKLENHTNSKKIDSKKNPLLRVGKIAMKKKVMLDITAVKVILIMISTKESVKKIITFLDKKQNY